MRRRRLRVVSSSDEEDVIQPPPLPPHQGGASADAVEIEVPSQDPIPNIQSVTLGSVEVEVSDDENFVDVSDNLSPPSPPPPMSNNHSVNASLDGSGSLNTSPFMESDCAVSDHLRRLGLRLKREWLDWCVRGLESMVPGFSRFDVGTRSKLCFGELLYSDMNYCGAGVLPQRVHEMHLVDLAGPFVLQVDEVVNISCPLRERYKNAHSGHKRCLKLSMTDGVQRVFGMEYRPIKHLEVSAPAGFKVVIQNVNVRRGLLILVPEVIEVLGGCVEEFEAARQRVVHEVNKPPRGKRSRTGVVPPLATRATLAAWPVNNSNDNPTNTSSSTLHNSAQFSAETSGHTSSVAHSNRTIGGMVDLSARSEVAELAFREASELPTSREMPAPPIGRQPSERPSGREATEPTTDRGSSEPMLVSVTDANVEDVDVDDYVEHPFVLRGDKELPFTYLASLSAKWAAMRGKETRVHGKIKCFLTGVKGFQYKQRITFELLVYVDDGSLISEILIHHDVVQKGIGYSPEEVTAALTSSDKKRVGEMKDTLKQFQIFLVNFEGTMVVEMNETSTVPVALEMSQGCPTSNAWLLLHRLKPLTSDHQCQNNQSNPITLSP